VKIDSQKNFFKANNRTATRTTRNILTTAKARSQFLRGEVGEHIEARALHGALYGDRPLLMPTGDTHQHKSHRRSLTLPPRGCLILVSMAT